MNVSEIGGLKYCRLLGAVRGHSSRTRDPWTIRTIFPAHPHPPITITVPTARVLHCPPTTSSGHSRTLIVTTGYIGGNDLPGQGQRQTPPQPLLVELGYRRKRRRHGLYFLLALFSLGFLRFPFLSWLVSSNTLTSLWKIGGSSALDFLILEFPVRFGIHRHIRRWLWISFLSLLL